MSSNAERLQDAIGLIDDDFILEAHAETAPERDANNRETDNVTEMQPAARRRKRLAKPLAIAACLVLALGVGVLAVNTFTAPTAKSDKLGEASLSTEAAAGEGGMAYDSVATGAGSGSLTPGTPVGNGIEEPIQQNPGEAFVLTGAEWNDNANWEFFTNLVNSNTISFPAYGIDPRHRVAVNVTDAAGNAVRNEAVTLADESGTVLWSARTNKDGVAYLFYQDGQSPSAINVAGTTTPVAREVKDGAQGEPSMVILEDVSVTIGSASAGASTDGLQVMFIVDTTGSMSDEIAYLQKDFAAIASDVGNDNVSYSVNFYRDEGDTYVTKCNGFTSDVAQVQQLLNGEVAEGGGDEPEAVADILAEAITNNDEWRSDCNKIAFLIFDAPPHEGTEAVLEQAVRSAAEQGITVVPVVASNAARETELFGRAVAICTNGTYVFLTDDSGVGNSHLEPIVGDYTVELLHDIIVRLIENAR